MDKLILGIFIGMLIGTPLGLVTTCLCVVAGKADKGCENDE